MKLMALSTETNHLPLSERRKEKRRPLSIDCKPQSPHSSESPTEGSERPYISAVPIHEEYASERSLGAVSFTQGSRASVRLLRDLASSELFAVKIGHSDSTGSLAWAISEYEVISSLSHPGIVKAVRLLIDQATWQSYMFMTLGETMNLTSYLEVHGPMKLAAVRDLARQLFDALAYLHSKRIAHRDINPNNVLYAGDSAVLIDFNTAVRIPLDGTLPTLQAVGTKGYKAPEIRNLDPCDEKVDVWSLGATLAFALGESAISDFRCFDSTVRDFFVGILTRDPKSRLSADEAKAHPWLSSNPYTC